MTHFWDDFPVIKDDLERVRRVILQSVESHNATIARALTELANRNGKMLRPGFVLLAARLKGDMEKKVSGPGEDGSAAVVLPQKIYNIAAAIEILHMATLVHDDVIDHAMLRRGDPTLHIEYGTKEAILMGDFLFSRCYRILSDNTSIENAKRLAVIISQIVEGEIDQSIDEDESILSPRRYIRRVVGKTASLIANSFYLGADEAGLGTARSVILHRVGYSIGMAFQIIDDVLDFTGSEQALGKPVASDLRQGVATLPLIYALRVNGNGSIRSLLKSPGNLSEGDIHHIIDRIDSCGGFDLAKQKADLYTKRALLQIGLLPKGKNRDTVAVVARRLLSRTY